MSLKYIKKVLIFPYENKHKVLIIIWLLKQILKIKFNENKNYSIELGMLSMINLKLNLIFQTKTIDE